MPKPMIAPNYLSTDEDRRVAADRVGSPSGSGTPSEAAHDVSSIPSVASEAEVPVAWVDT